MLILFANNTYANTNSVYVENEGSVFGKIVVLVMDVHVM